MTSTAFVAVVEPDHRVKAPASIAIGATVLVVPMPSATELLQDTARRARFASTRRAVREAMQAGDKGEGLTDEAIVSLVHRARQSSRAD